MRCSTTNCAHRAIIGTLCLVCHDKRERAEMLGALKGLLFAPGPESTRRAFAAVARANNARTS